VVVVVVVVGVEVEVVDIVVVVTTRDCGAHEARVTIDKSTKFFIFVFSSCILMESRGTFL